MLDFTSYSFRSRPTEPALGHLQLGEEPAAALLREARRERDGARGAAIRTHRQQAARDCAAQKGNRQSQFDYGPGFLPGATFGVQEGRGVPKHSRYQKRFKKERKGYYLVKK